MRKLALSNLSVLISPKLLPSDHLLYKWLLHYSVDQGASNCRSQVSLENLAVVYDARVPLAVEVLESISRLMQVVIRFEHGGVLYLTGLFAEARLLGSTLSYRYSTHCKQWLADPFTLDQCLAQANFTHKYSDTIYQLLAASIDAGQNILDVSVAALRASLGIAGKKLVNFGDFNRFVLSPALKEINQYAGFEVEIKRQMKGVKVVGLTFLMQKKVIQHAG